MKTGLIRIGNSRGIRIPKTIIEQCGFGDTVDIHVEENRLIIAPEKQPRHGWREAFAAARSEQTDSLFLDTLAPNEFDNEEWTW
jgi:antitoxin MazE